MTRWQVQTSKESKHVRYLGQSTELMKNRLEVIPYNPMIAHPTQIFQATREARLISEDVEAPSVEDEGLGAEEVLTVTKFYPFQKTSVLSLNDDFLAFTFQTTTGYV